jgi:hypothetical protein
MIRALKASLQRIADRDPEQEVQGMALPVLDQVVSVARDALPGHPVIARLEVITPELVGSGEPIRAVDAMVAIDVLFEVLKRA